MEATKFDERKCTGKVFKNLSSFFFPCASWGLLVLVYPLVSSRSGQCLSSSLFSWMVVDHMAILAGGGHKPLAFRPRIKFARGEQFQQWFIASAPGEVTPMLREWISDIKIHETHLPVSFLAEIAAKLVCVEDLEDP